MPNIKDNTSGRFVDNSTANPDSSYQITTHRKPSDKAVQNAISNFISSRQDLADTSDVLRPILTDFAKHLFAEVK